MIKSEKDKDKDKEKDKKLGGRVRATARDKTILKIEKTSLALFSSHSYDGTTIRMIAEKTGISLGLMYNYFSSKEDLMKSLVHNGISTMIEHLEAATEKSANASEFFKSYFKEIEKNKSFVKFILNIKAQSIAYKNVKKDIDLLEENIEKMCKRHVDAAFSRRAQFQILAYLDGLSLHLLNESKDLNIDDHINLLVTHLEPKTAPEIIIDPKKKPREKEKEKDKEGHKENPKASDKEDDKDNPRFIQTSLFD